MTYPKANYVECSPYGIISHFLLGRVDKLLKKKLDAFSPDAILIPMDRYVSYGSVPVVCMVTNMEPFVANFPEDSIKVRIIKYVQYIVTKKAVRKSDQVVAISNFVREFLLNQWNIPSSKVTLIYHGDSGSLLNKEGDPPGSIPNGWKKNFLFTCGSIRPARGLEDIINTMKDIAGKSLVKGLVIAGEFSPGMIRYKRKLHRLVEDLGLSSKVLWTGGLDEAQLTWCYQNCSIFVMTSRVESFGLVALEAMSHGCISIAANNPCLPEIFGDTAIYYPPTDSRSLSKKIIEVLHWDEKERDAMSMRARSRASQYSWEINAKKTVEVLSKAIETSKRSVHGMESEIREVET